MSRRHHTLGTRTLWGMAWAYGAYVGGRVLVLLQTAVLARVLVPADFGLVALALTFMVFLDAIKDMGLGQALIVGRDGEEEERAQTAFGWGVALGVALAIVTAASGPLVASFFDEPALIGLMPVYGATFLVRALGATHYALARKMLNYRVRTASEISEVVVRGVIGIGLALTGFGAWSLAFGFLAGTIASTAVLWTLVDFRPRARLARAYLKEMLAFGGMLTLVDIGSVLGFNLNQVFIGRVLGTTALGYYAIGLRLPELIVLNLAIVAGDVLFPAYAAADRERLRDAYLVALRYTAMLTLPLGAVLIVLAKPLILVVFGDQWGEAASTMQLLTAGILLTTLSIPCGTIFKVTGRAWVLVAVTVPGLVALVALLAVFTHEGIATVALCGLVLDILTVPVMVAIASRQMRLPYFANLRAIGPAVGGASAMTLVLLLGERAFDDALLTLLVALPAATAVYLACVAALMPSDLRRLWRMAFPG